MKMRENTKFPGAAPLEPLGELKVPTKPKVNVTVKLFQYDKISSNRFSDDKNEGKRTEDK